MQTYTLTEAPRAMKDVQAHVEKDKVVLLTSRGRPELAVLHMAQAAHVVLQARSLQEWVTALNPLVSAPLSRDEAKLAAVLNEIRTALGTP
jgi:hypothetical protein